MSESVQQRISDEEALDMLKHMPTAELMARANEIQRQGMATRSITHSHNLNPTNLCVEV